MSASTIDKIVKETITICDICGGEIELDGAYSDEDTRMNVRTRSLVGDTTPGELTVDQVRQVKFLWPIGKRRKELEERKKTETGRSYAFIERVAYDFHGECVANLVTAAVELRKANESEAEK